MLISSISSLFLFQISLNGISTKMSNLSLSFQYMYYVLQRVSVENDFPGSFRLVFCEFMCVPQNVCLCLFFLALIRMTEFELAKKIAVHPR